MTGTLYLAPAPLDFGCEPPLPAITEVLPLGTLQQMARLRHWVCENAKTTRALLKRIETVTPLVCTVQEMQITELPRELHKKGDHAGNAASAHAPDTTARVLLQPAIQGHDMALCSEAGMPAVADPGSSLVRAAHAASITVIPLAGPSALLLALAASGLNGQNFAFVGYLPQDATQRAKRLKELEHLAIKTGQTQLWIETPYRNQSVLEQALHTLQPQTRLCVACGLTLATQRIWMNRIATLRQQPPALPARMPAVFGLGV